MKAEHKAAIVTVAAIIGFIIFLAVREQGKRGDSTRDEKPARVAYDLFQRAEKGDVQGYLACFDSGLRQTIEASRGDMGEEAFRDHIVRIGTAVNGVAVSEERGDAREMRLRVELVYADRAYNDVHTFTVVKRRDRWLISAMSDARQVKMPIPYGTPAYPLEMDVQEGEQEAESGREASETVTEAGADEATESASP